jgi:surfactin synthase thioesterase subunit
MTTALRQPAIVRLGQIRAPQARLVCVPQAGGGTATFRPLTAVLPPSIDLCAVRLPGRESRRREQSLRRMEDVTAEIIGGLSGMDDLPLVLLGYCSGAITAYQVASELAQTGRPPARLIVLASPGPRVIPADGWAHTLSEPEFLDYLRRFQVTPEQILGNRELFTMFEPGVRADFETFETWAYRPGPPLDLPVTVIGARDDSSVDFEELLMWHSHTIREFTVRILPGGHDFLGAATNRLGQVLAKEICP